MLSLLILACVLTRFGKSSIPDSVLSHENATEYELVHFNLHEFYSFGIIEFDYNDTHYKVKLIKNGHISPIINHQTDKNISITHHTKPDDSWYVNRQISINQTVKRLTSYFNHWLCFMMTSRGVIVYILETFAYAY